MYPFLKSPWFISLNHTLNNFVSIIHIHAGNGNGISFFRLTIYGLKNLWICLPCVIFAMAIWVIWHSWNSKLWKYESKYSWFIIWTIYSLCLILMTQCVCWSLVYVERHCLNPTFGANSLLRPELSPAAGPGSLLAWRRHARGVCQSKVQYLKKSHICK